MWRRFGWLVRKDSMRRKALPNAWGVGRALSIEIESLSVEAKFVYDVVVTTSN